MHRRWLSVRGPKDSKDTKDGVSVTQDHFDFEFVTSSQEVESPLSASRANAAMFNTASFRHKKPKSDLPSGHSSSAAKYAVDKRLQLTKVEDSWIGVAFGSPTHPPTHVPCFSSTDSLASQKHSTRQEVPLPPPPPLMPVTRSKKFSNLFKSKPSQVSISAPTHVCRIDGDRKLGMPVARKPWQGPNSPPTWVNSENPEAFSAPPAAVFSGNTPITDRDSSGPSPPPAGSQLPRLEIQIPNIKLDRYSVMFSDISGIKPSSLLERRSRNLSNLKLGGDEVTDIPPVPPLKPSHSKRPTTPTHHRRKSSTYSLFPSPPKPKARPHEDPERRLPRRQLSFSGNPVVAPARTPPPPAEKVVLPIEDYRLTPERNGAEMLSISPDDTIASSERNFSPWRSVDSVQSVPSSRTSVESELFFDLKPTHDHDGREPQYIIHKPDSPTMELAISNSRRARRARDRRGHEQTMFNTSPDLQAAEFMLQVEEKWRLSMELNQAIAEVERLTSPLTTMLPSIDSFEFPVPASETTPKPLLPPIKLRKRLDELAMAIPSPITERSEEFSPRLASPMRTTGLRPRQHIASLSIRPAPLNLNPDALKIVGDFSITPPPVPVKDAQFLPMSKFSANNTSVKLVEHRPKRRKPRRSITDNSLSLQRTGSESGNSRKDRPATMTSALRPPTKTPFQSLPTSNQAIQPVLAAICVPPTAEVSVARTVALQRKQSSQILVSGAATNREPGLTSDLAKANSIKTTGSNSDETARRHRAGASLDSSTGRFGY